MRTNASRERSALRPLRAALLLPLALLFGCTSQAAQPPVFVPLPAGSLDLAALDPDHFAVLLRRGKLLGVAVVLREQRTVQSGFDIKPGAVSIGAAGSDQVLVLRNEDGRGWLDTYSTIGRHIGSVPISGRAIAIAESNGDRAYVLVERDGRALLEQISITTGKVFASTQTPPDAIAAAARTSNSESSLLVGNKRGALFERVPGSDSWQRLPGTGFYPTYSESGNAIYAVQHLHGTASVAVIERPSGLQVRLFPVSAGVRRLYDAPDGSLIILDAEGNSATARVILCRSPLVAIVPNTYKHGKFIDLDYWQDRPDSTPAPGTLHSPNPSEGC